MVEPMATQAGGIKGSFPALLVAGKGDAVIEFIQDGFTRQARNPGPLRLDPVSGALGDILFLCSVIKPTASGSDFRTCW